MTNSLKEPRPANWREQRVIERPRRWNPQVPVAIRRAPEITQQLDALAERRRIQCFVHHAEAVATNDEDEQAVADQEVLE